MDLNTWLLSAKKNANAKDCGMYLIHNGVVRDSSRKEVREGIATDKVKAMKFSYDKDTLNRIIEEAKKEIGIKYVDAYLNEGVLNVGDDLMYVLVGGDTREHVLDTMNKTLTKIKTICVKEEELF